MSENGILMYDLAGNWCEQCGQPKLNRALDMLTGCPACDEVVTRHRCPERPAITDRAPGQSWECPDCGRLWRLAEREEPCPDCCCECDHTVTRRRWDLEEEGDRIDTAPRHKPEPYTPLWNALRSTVNSLYARPRTERPSFGTCHRTDKGIMVHVKPGCRC